MIKIEVAVTAHQVEAVVETILRAAKTGQTGDGKRLVPSTQLKVDDVVLVEAAPRPRPNS